MGTPAPSPAWARLREAAGLSVNCLSDDDNHRTCQDRLRAALTALEAEPAPAERVELCDDSMVGYNARINSCTLWKVDGWKFYAERPVAAKAKPHTHRVLVFKPGVGVELEAMDRPCADPECAEAKRGRA